LSKVGATHSSDSGGIRISEYVESSEGLTLRICDQDRLQIHQRADGKKISFSMADIEEVLSREDADGKPFLQVNFVDGRKILVTSNLIGFKPAYLADLDMNKLPKVVTTPDLLSVVEAIEDALQAAENSREEVELLRRVFESVLLGAENVGFDIQSEKVWMRSLTSYRSAANA
jgi:hypothetical protein